MNRFQLSDNIETPSIASIQGISQVILVEPDGIENATHNTFAKLT
jgi:hypothetical protein